MEKLSYRLLFAKSFEKHELPSIILIILLFFSTKYMKLKGSSQILYIHKLNSIKMASFKEVKDTRIKFSSEEDKILLKIVENCLAKGKLRFKNVEQYYNKAIQTSLSEAKPRNFEVLRQRYSYIVTKSQMKKSAWNQKLERRMLEMVQNNSSWKQIASDPLFSELGFTNSFIQKQFQTCQRMKFRALKTWSKVNQAGSISDKTFQTIMRSSEVSELFNKGVLSFREKQILLQSQNFMLSSRFKPENQKVRIRRQQMKNILENYGLNDSNIRELTLAIIQVNNHVRFQREKNYETTNKNDEQISTYYQDQNLFEESHQVCFSDRILQFDSSIDHFSIAFSKEFKTSL